MPPELVTDAPRQDRRADLAAVAAILALLVALTAFWAPRSFWWPDSFFYRANVLELRGTPERQALDEVWDGHLAAGFRAYDASRPGEQHLLADPRWIPYTSEFFERRIVAPALAAAIEPLAGEDGLEVVSIAGVFAFALLLFALLRGRFAALASAVAVCACLLWPPVRWGFMPLTEGAGLALLALALLAAARYLDHGRRRWLAAGALAVLVLGFTRDLTPVAVLAAVAVLVVHRTPRSLALTGATVAAALPAPLLLGAPLREQLAYGLGGRQVPDDASWGFVLSEYPGQAWTAIESGLDYLFAADPVLLEGAWPLLPFTLLILAGLVALLFARTETPRDHYLTLIRGGLAGAVVAMWLNPFFTHFRYQLVVLPMAAVGIAFAVERLTERLAGRLPATAADAAQPGPGR